jgi:hypothetical protein
VAMADLTYISEGNEKTSCYSFDLPAKVTCPGATEACKKACYAFKLAQVYANVGRKYLRNHEFAQTDGFVRYMIANIPHGCEFRIHVSGDFFSVEYIEKWKRIAKARKDVTFYTYTRSWRIDELWFALMELNALSNMNVNLSVDKETGMPEVPYADDYRWCYLSSDDSAPEWMRREDIVFRTNHNARQGNHQWKRKKAIATGKNPDVVAPLLHRIAGATVCPFERGKDMPASFSCSQCGLCINKPKHAKVNV